MSLHPIKALDSMLEEYRNYLLTEFRAKDPQLREALEKEIDSPLFLAQEPFFQAHRPFKQGALWNDLPLDPKLAKVMKDRSGSGYAYIHQSESISNLLGPNPSPLTVTTGTGSGKTECFLLPVIQNAINDAVLYKKNGLTAILIYPMNALANDQYERINEYLASSGFEGVISVAQYDRGTSQAQRESLRKNPPHILLTNYMMLEYLLTRPADRDAIFANHRCRFLVLDEVHTYRGTLGTNIALLVRRLRSHLGRAVQDWNVNVPEPEQNKRFPRLIPVGTSATIKSADEVDLDPLQVIIARNQAVQEFFSKLTGVEPDSIMVLGEELAEIAIPPQACYAPIPPEIGEVDINNTNDIRKTLCRLAGISTDSSLVEAASSARIIWDLGSWLIKKPMSVTQLAEKMKEIVPERQNAEIQIIGAEVEAALLVGAALPDGIPGNLRLRVHRFLRGGWAFHRCVNPDCGRLYPMGEEKCVECGCSTAPLYLCRTCGADYMRFVGEDADDASGQLRPSSNKGDTPEWLLYDPARFDFFEDEDDEDSEETEDAAPRRKISKKKDITMVKKRHVADGSFDGQGLDFSYDPNDYSWQVKLTPSRSRCLCCGGRAGSRDILTPIALGTSAAIKVVGEGLVEALAVANARREGHDGKERLLIFSDSRQDAAHQARFIRFAGRYDRMRRRVYKILKQQNPIPYQRLIEQLGVKGIENQDNPYVPPGVNPRIGQEVLERIRAWEEAPFLDEIALSARYRATLLNLGLVAVDYEGLHDYIASSGLNLSRHLLINTDQLEHIARSILDYIRRMGSINRELLSYHPGNPGLPDYLRHAEWERSQKAPSGYGVTDDGEPLLYSDQNRQPSGIKQRNFWRKPGAGGLGPTPEIILRRILGALGVPPPHDEDMLDLIKLLVDGQYLVNNRLFGIYKPTNLLQINWETISIRLLDEKDRYHCNVCGAVMPLRGEGWPCPVCHGFLVNWTDTEAEQNRFIQRIKSDDIYYLVAGEHTAQVPGSRRLELEEDFKATPDKSPLNVLACSPTLEMGIDVGGLDAVVMRNIPPRPDNYAQRGGRAGRRTRVGLVVGYARNTPHDQYFYDRPEEMIAGEVPAPLVPLGNRDVILRHLASVAFGSAEPGLAGRMVEYISPQGEINKPMVDNLITAVQAQSDYAVNMCLEAFGPEILGLSELDEVNLKGYMDGLPERIRDIFERTSKQVRELRQALDAYAQDLRGERAGTRAGKLIARLLGLPDERRRGNEADDRSAGYPLRRFAEFGILPGYEFPTQPSTLRLLGDPNEDDAISVERRFGLNQFQPGAPVYARAARWKVVGLDNSSPWNPRVDEPGWQYRICKGCGLRYFADEPRCRRCGVLGVGQPLPAYEYAGFLGRREEKPVLDEEERYAAKNNLTGNPQWDGRVTRRWITAEGWSLRLSKGEEVRWLNEGLTPTESERQKGFPLLHQDALGWYLCPACGRMLDYPEPENETKGRRRTAGNGGPDKYGHAPDCALLGQGPTPLALQTCTHSEILRLIIPVPAKPDETFVKSWGLSLGMALRIGMRHHFMLDGSEIEFALEGHWEDGAGDSRCNRIALSFIDASLGGSGFLERMGDELHLIAKKTIEHLDHQGCETACYRCLKSYNNQRYHHLLNWPLIINELESLAQNPPQTMQLEMGDLQDPRPWLEAYDAGVGSPLELKFLRLFEQYGCHPEKQVPVAASEGELPISVADFAIPEKRIAIYIDGAAFHVGQNLRRDMFIRKRLREGSPPWEVIELRATDLNKISDIVKRLKDK